MRIPKVIQGRLHTGGKTVEEINEPDTPPKKEDPLPKWRKIRDKRKRRRKA